MSGLRNIIRRWLGVPSADQIAHIARREIDADAAWKDRVSAKTVESERRDREISRNTAIAFGYREDTRVNR